jgi:ABC-2 type transport system permease protein
MTATVTSTGPRVVSTSAPQSALPTIHATHRWRDVVALTVRNLLHIRGEPMQLSDVTIQPVLFTVLFIYVFGAAVAGAGSYTQYAIAGLVAMNLTTSAMGTAVGLSTDLQTGVIDRFRGLPMWKPAVLVGRSAADLLTAVLCSAIVAVTGLIIGWRPDANPLSVVAGFLLFFLFSYSLSWMCACIGLSSKGPESAQGLGLIALFPLAIVSNALVPTNHMPAAIRFLADWNPVSAVTAAARNLWGNPNPSAAINIWPMQHPVEASLLWCAALLLIFVPIAISLYRKRTTE